MLKQVDSQVLLITLISFKIYKGWNSDWIKLLDDAEKYSRKSPPES